MLSSEVIYMTKSMITKVWIGGLAVFAAGIVVSIVGAFLMLGYGGTFTQVAGTSNYNFVPNINGFFWLTVGLAVTAGLWDWPAASLSSSRTSEAWSTASHCLTRLGSGSCCWAGC